MFQPIEISLDFVSVFVKIPVYFPLDYPIALWRNNDFTTFPFQIMEESIIAQSRSGASALRKASKMACQRPFLAQRLKR
jgi:hypothetical protein